MSYSPVGQTQKIGEVTSLTPTSVSVGTSSTQIVAANPSRRFLFLFNSGNFDVFLSGDGTSQLNKGIVLQKGERIIFSSAIDITTSIHGIVQASTSNVLIMEFE